MAPVDPRSAVADYLAHRGRLAAAVRVDQTTINGAVATRVVVRDERVPKPGGGRRSRWRITNEWQTNLSHRQFVAHPANRVNEASVQKGRSVYCWDHDRQEVIAAIRYHVKDLRSPILLLAIALRIDDGPDSALSGESLLAAVLIKEYIHEIARQMKKLAGVRTNQPAPPDDAVDFMAQADSDEETVCRRLGFTPRGVPGGTRDKAKKRFLRQLSVGPPRKAD